jgi:hypothetical protein
LRSCGKIRRDSAGQLAVTSVEVKHGGSWCIPGKQKLAFMKEKLKLDLVMNLSGKMAYDPNKNLLFR